MKLQSQIPAILLVACGVGLLSPVLAGNGPSAQAAANSFYSWYVPRAVAARNEPAWATVLSRKPATLSVRLQHELTFDLAKKARASGTIEGIDFDPFLGGQDPCPQFAIGKTRMEQNRYLIDIKPVCPSGPEQPPVTVWLIRTKLGFVIDDVTYGDGDTLRHALQAK
jgi:hypothetical protein